MKKVSDVFKSIRFAKGEPRGTKHPSTDDEEHGAVGETEFDQQLAHAKKRAMQEEVELDEMAGANMDTRALHSHLKKGGWKLSRTSGSHDVFTHPEAKDHIAVPRHRQLKAPLVKAILKQSKVNESIDESKGYSPGWMLKKDSKLGALVKAAKERKKYVPGKPSDEYLQRVKDDEYERKVTKYLKKKYAKEEFEQLQEGRPSQRHPLEGHEYHKKTNAELEYIAKDAHKAAEAMKGHNTDAENKYRDQANDSATVRYYRQRHGMADWYKKKYGHMNEEFVAEGRKLYKQEGSLEKWTNDAKAAGHTVVHHDGRKDPNSTHHAINKDGKVVGKFFKATYVNNNRGHLHTEGVAEGYEERKNAPGWHSGSQKNPNFNDELSIRRVNAVGKRLKSGKLSADERGSQERLKTLMKFKKEKGGLTGPKGMLPEEQGLAEGSAKQFEIIYREQNGDRKRKIVSGTSKEAVARQFKKQYKLEIEQVKQLQQVVAEGKMKQTHPDSELPDAEPTGGNNPPFDKPYTTKPATVKDKSGAVHTGMSRARHIARMAARRNAGIKEDIDTDTTPAKQSLQATSGMTKQLDAEKKTSSKKVKKDQFETEPELSSSTNKQ